MILRTKVGVGSIVAPCLLGLMVGSLPQTATVVFGQCDWGCDTSRCYWFRTLGVGYKVYNDDCVKDGNFYGSKPRWSAGATGSVSRSWQNAAEGDTDCGLPEYSPYMSICTGTGTWTSTTCNANCPAPGE